MSSDTEFINTIEHGDLASFKLFIEKEEHKNKSFTNGDSALLHASKTGKLEIVKFLIENNAIINETNKLKKNAFNASQ